jgi:3-hydroxy-9,10-secoandrosta-1,3,5(10)-triene-9,17-dione monooxygenase
VPECKNLIDPRERAELLSVARELVPLLRSNASETERRRNLAPQVDEALRSAGFYTLTAPRKFGGREAGVRTIIEVFSELARGCGSSAWVGKIHCGAAFMASLFGDEARQDVWGENSHAAVSASTNGSATNTARAVQGGVTASGEWHYASGVHQAQWVICDLSVDHGDSGHPDARRALIPASDISINSTWDVAGMEGTGSDSFVVREVFVPTHRTIPLMRLRDDSARTGDELEKVYRTSLPSMLGLSIAGPVIGMARGALEHVLSMLENGRPVSGSTYANAVDSPGVQLAVAEAASLIDTAELHAYRAADDVEAASVHGHHLDVPARARIRMDTGVVMLRCREAVERLLDLGGAAGFARSNPLQRFWRDLTTATRHALVSPSLNREIYGRALLGITEQNVEIV